MSRLHDMMEELERQRRRGNFRGAENIAKLEMKNYELEGNTPYYNFYRGVLWYLYDFPHEAMMHFDNALLTEDRDMYYVHKFKGVVSLESGEFERARDSFEKALAEASDPADIASAMNALANTYLRMGQPDRSLDLYREALRVSMNANLDELSETILANIGVAHVNKGDHEGSIRYFEDAMLLAKALNDDRGMRICLNNMASAFNNMGKHEDALAVYNDALHYAGRADDRYGLRVIYTNIGYTYRMMGDVHHALEYYTLALGTAQQINDREGEALAKYWITTLQKGEEQAAAS
ncbi:MAG: photosystem I assembly protein Ycf3 [Methanocella sp. PtaU1.Bin125]|nr:MAG: photosystem I assembly protein Ycf3 [Methanocella sp. PtaU1.Bin125]